MKISRVASDDRIKLAGRIRVARRDAKLTQTALAERVGVTPSAAAQWEHPNGTSPGTPRLQEIAAATGVAFEWLATGRGERRQRRSVNPETVPALKLDVYAQDWTEEILLERFRLLSPRAKQMLVNLLEEVRPGRTGRR
jgi:transcriptional regulator with XRE-family HTH domain